MSVDTRLRLFGPPVLFVLGTLFYRLNTLVDFDYSELYRYDIAGLIGGYVNWHIARWVILRLQKRYPGISRTRRRFGIYGLLLPLLVTSGTILRTQPIYWVGLDPSGDTSTGWFKLDAAGTTFFRQYLLTAGIQLVHHCVYLAIYESLYLFSQWQQLYAEKERLLRAEWQARFDAMSSQVNPHFLFNSLNTLSALIAEAPVQAETFVDKLSGVYRYVLRANEQPLTTLESELQFIEAYYHLLKTRYGDGLNLTVDVQETHRSGQLPPLTLQLLVENAVKHNVISPKRPLNIWISSTETGLLVSNTLQRKKTAVLSNGVGLANIGSKYQLMNLPAPVITETDERFTVRLPLLVASVV